MSQLSKIGKASMRKKNRPSLPGNDGTWFLDMVGATPSADGASPAEATKPDHVPVVEMAPSAMSTVAARRNRDQADQDSTQTSAPPTTLDLTSVSDPPPDDGDELAETTHTGSAAPLAAAVAAAPATEPPSTQEPEAGPTSDTTQVHQVPPSVRDTWRPAAPQPTGDLTGDALAPTSEKPTSKKRSRWPILVTAVVAVAAIAVAALWLPALIDGRASETADGYRTSLVAMRQTLPEAQSGLALATEPRSQESDLLAAAPLVAPLSNASTAAVAVAAEPLPEPLPLMPSGPIDDLEPNRVAVEAAGSDGLAITQRVEDTIVYRTQLAEVLTLPDLPIEAGPSQIEALEVALALVAVDSAAAVSALPTDSAFTDHRALVAEAVSRLPEWSQDYLDALRQGDTALAAELVAEAEEVRPTLVRALVPALATMRAEVDAAILMLNDDIGAVLVALPD